jgi:hypothetical protein
MLSSAYARWADSGALWLHMSTAIGSAGHDEEGKHEEKLTFSASNSLKLLYLPANIGSIKKIPTEEHIPVLFLTLSLRYFFDMVNIQGVIYL